MSIHVGPDGYVEAECQAAEAHGTFAVPRFTPPVAAGEPVVRRVVLVRTERGWEFGAGTVGIRWPLWGMEEDG